MAQIKKVAKTKKIEHKDIEKELVTAVAELKAKLDDKKFKRRLKKAIKVLTHGIGKKKTGKAKTIKKASKKVAVKKVAKPKVK